MQVLGHGNTFKRVKCPCCNAELGYTKVDIINKGKYLIETDEWVNIKYIFCPECKERIIINEKII